MPYQWVPPAAPAASAAAQQRENAKLRQELENLKKEVRSDNAYRNWRSNHPGNAASHGNVNQGNGNRNRGGQGAGQGQGNGLVCGVAGGKWACYWLDCVPSCQGKTNNAKNTTCFGCGRAKNLAKNPPDSSKRKVAAGGGGGGAGAGPAPAAAAVNKDQQAVGAGNGRKRSAEQVEKRRLARERRRERKAEADGQADQAAVADGKADAVMGGAAQPAGAANEPKPLAKEDQAVLKALGLTAAMKVGDLKSIFSAPKETKDQAGTAEEEVALVCTKNDALAAAIANEALYQASVDENTGVPGREHLLGVVTAQLDEWKKKVADLSKKPAGQGQAALSDLVAKRALEVAKEDKLKAAAEADSNRVAARFARLKAVVTDQQAILTERLQALEEAYQASRDLWQASDNARAAKHKLKLGAWDSRIVAATPACGAMQPVEPAVAAVVEVARAAMAHADCYRVCSWSLQEIPELQPPSEGAVPVLSTLNANVNYWSQNGMVPVTYAQLYSGCDLPKMSSNPIQSATELVGEILWRRFYPEGCNVSQDHYVPMQLGSILAMALGRISDQITAKVRAEQLKECEAHFERLAQKDREDRINAAGAYGSPY